MRACRPEVEKFGFVLPNRNGPHSGCPYLAQPAGSVASAKTSLHPSALFGQPSASAIGCGMAMTSGVFMNGVPVLAMGDSPLAVSCWSRTAPHALEAGVQMTGAGLLPSVFQPSASAWAAAPEASECGFTKTHLPPTCARVWLNDWASDVSRSILSVDMVRLTTRQLPGSPT